MRQVPFVLFTSLTLIALLPAQQRGGGRGRDREAAPPKLEHFTFETGTVQSSKVRSGEPGYGIYLPKGYADDANKDTKYPWILWLHGFGGPGEFQSGGGVEVLDALRGADKVPPLAMVVFRNAGRRTTYMNGETAADTEDLIVGDLIDTLVKKYRLSTERGQRAVMGVSAGGFGALKIAMRHPEVFGTVAVHSAAILPVDPDELAGSNEMIVQRMLRGGLSKELGDPIDKAKWQAHMPLAIVAAKKPEDLKGLHVYFDAGTDDNYGFCEPNEQLAKAMTKNGHKHLFRKVEGGGHAWNSPSIKECLAVSLQFVGAAFSGKDPIEACTPKKDGKAAGPDPKEGKEEEKGEDSGSQGAHGGAGLLLPTTIPCVEVPLVPDLAWSDRSGERRCYFSISR